MMAGTPQFVSREIYQFGGRPTIDIANLETDLSKLKQNRRELDRELSRPRR